MAAIEYDRPRDSPDGRVLIVRLATADDDPAVRQVVDDAYRPLREIYRPTDAAVARRHTDSTRYERLVAELGGRLVATLEFRLDEQSLHIRGLAVDPLHQRRGVARSLVEYVIDAAAAYGRSRVTLFTIRQTGNVDFFERLGFRVVAEEIADWCESDRFRMLHDVRMERPVP